jgi:hypothetical protein
MKSPLEKKRSPSGEIAGDSGRVIYGSLEAVLSLAQEVL